MRDAIRVLLVDDHLVLRQGLRLLLERESDIEIAGEASSMAEAVAFDGPVDIVLTDLVLPDSKDATGIAQLAARFSTAAIFVLSMIDVIEDVELSFRSGARGYMLKESAASELVEALRRVARGEEYMQPSLGAALARWTGGGRDIDRLSEREREVLRLLALGNTNAQVAEQLDVSLRTVESHRAAIGRKLNAHSRAELVQAAMEGGLYPPPGTAKS